MTNLKQLLAAAQSAASDAGSFLKDNPDRTIDHQTQRDVKLSADRASETLIRNSLADTGIPILGEEGGDVGEARPDGLRWIVDPIDGTVNYLRGIPFHCVSIGLWRNEAPVLGVVLDFARGETFTGIAGEGAWLNGKDIRVSVVDRDSDAILCTGFPVGGDFSSEELPGFVDSLQAYRKVRLLGSAALMLAYVASGRVDAYYEKGIRTWDIAGGLGILLGAGGVMDMSPTKKLNSYRLFASNGRLKWRKD